MMEEEKNKVNNENANGQEDQLEVFSDSSLLAVGQDVGANGLSAETPKKKKGGKIALIVILLLCIAGFCGYKYMSNNPTEIIKDVINRSYEDFSAALKKLETVKSDDDDIIDLLNESFKVSGSINFKDSNYKNLEKEKINYTFGLDYKNKVAEARASLTKNGSTLADGNIFFKHDRMFLTSKSLLKSKYNLGEYEFDTMFDFSAFENQMNNQETLSFEDIDYIVREFKNALVSALDKEEMTISKEVIDIEGRSVKTSKISYNLDEQAVASLNDSIIDYVLANDELLEKMATMSGETKEDLEDSLEYGRYGDDYEFESESSATFALYTTGLDHKVIKVELTDDEQSLEVIFQDDKTQLIYQDENQKIEIQVTKKNERYEVVAYLNNKEVAVINIKEISEEVIDIDYVYEYDSYDVKGSIKFTKKEISDKEVDFTMDFSISGKVDGVSNNFGVSITMKFERGVEIARDDMFGAIDSSNITDEDMEYLMEKVSDLQDTEIFKVFSDLLTTNEMREDI